MKSLLVVFLACSALAMQKAILGLGKSCVKSSPFIVTNFDVQPYPPTAGQVMLVAMSGSFSKTEFVADIATKVNYNGGRYTTKYVDVNKDYIYGQVNVFYVNVTAGTQAGIYDVQIHLESKQGSSISCWDYTYHI